MRCPQHQRRRNRCAIHEAIDKLKTDGVSTEELKMVKTRSKAALFAAWPTMERDQSAENQLKIPAIDELFRRIDKIDAVTNDDVKRVANEVFVDTDRTVGIIGMADEKGNSDEDEIPDDRDERRFVTGLMQRSRARRKKPPRPRRGCDQLESSSRFPNCLHSSRRSPSARCSSANGMIVSNREPRTAPHLRLGDDSRRVGIGTGGTRPDWSRITLAHGRHRQALRRRVGRLSRSACGQGGNHGRQLNPSPSASTV